MMRTETNTVVSQEQTAFSFQPFRTAAVLGAGTMGAQIAAHLANAGLSVLLLDLAATDAANKRAHVEQLFAQARKAKPSPFFTNRVERRVTLGTLEDDLEKLATVDWVVEAVVEKLGVKQQLMARVEKTIGDDTVVSSNTSGLSVQEITKGRSAGFKSRFLGTHFFNPPRYLKLLEVVPTSDTDQQVLERVKWFGRMHLGKGVVVAKDTPGFIANRIGVYAMMQALQTVVQGKYTIEEVDALTGRVAGRKKSATFRTADLVGLDVLTDVAANLYDNVPEDSQRKVFQVPEVLKRLVAQGKLGAKTKAGFYKKVDGQVQSVDLETLNYKTPGRDLVDELDTLKDISDLSERLRALYQKEGKVGAFFREHILNVLAYSAHCIPEVTSKPADIDRAVCWGFGWKKGPFETWDILGIEQVLADMETQSVEVPDWVKSMRANGVTSFYQGQGSLQKVYVPSEGYVEDPVPSDELQLPVIKTKADRILRQGKKSNLLDLGKGVALFEFRSKGNTLGKGVIEQLFEAIDRVETGNFRGLVIGNEGRNFSYGANLGEIAMAAAKGAFDEIEAMVVRFQQLMKRIRYAGKPVVAALHQRVLGGGCELGMASPYPVAAAESYVGLVELGVGVIPAGGGCAALAARAYERAAQEHPSQIQDQLQPLFETVGQAKVATSAQEAQAYGFLPDHARIVMNADRRFYVAREEVVRLFEEGYMPPPPRTAIKVLGRSTRAAFKAMAYNLQQGGYASKYDMYLADRLAYVLTGGDIHGPVFVHEDYLMDLEREVFMSLLGEKKTQQRITHMLMQKEPLRN